MRSDEYIIGFDAREMWYSNGENMGIHTQGKTFLFSDEVQKPLSVDSSIWGSVFNDGCYPDLSDDERKRKGLGTIALPPSIGINNPLWENLNQLTEYLDRHDAEIGKSFWVIAITGLLHDKGRKRSPEDWPHFESTSPSNIQKEWILVGYDVNTCWNECCLTGALHGGGEDQIQSLRNMFGPHLNKYHLFIDVKHARKFSEFQDQLAQEDAPHSVYGIWLIREVR